MHFTDPPPPPDKPAFDFAVSKGPWWREMNRYHWFVFTIAALGWMCDTMDQQLFNIARDPAIRTMLTNQMGETPPDGLVKENGGYATSIFLIGWGTGGLIFGVLGDLVGRARCLMLSILLYSLFTGLSALSTSVLDLSLIHI